jgi:hypothetical protein
MRSFKIAKRQQVISHKISAQHDFSRCECGWLLSWAHKATLTAQSPSLSRSTPAYHPIETAGHPAHPYTVDQDIHPDPADLDRPSAVAGEDAVAAWQIAAVDSAAAVGAD